MHFLNALLDFDSITLGKGAILENIPGIVWRPSNNTSRKIRCRAEFPWIWNLFLEFQSMKYDDFAQTFDQLKLCRQDIEDLEDIPKPKSTFWCVLNQRQIYIKMLLSRLLIVEI